MLVQIKQILKCRYVTLRILVLILISSQRLVHSAPVPFAFVGQTSPIGGTYLGFPGSPVLNESGQILFYSSLTGGTANNGLFVGTPGSFQPIVYQGLTAPDGGTFNGATNYVLNANGQAVFVSNITGGSAANGIFVGTPGSIQTIALAGTAAPAGGNYDSFSPPNINSFGKVVFRSTLTSGSSTHGSFTGVPGSIDVVALQGSSAPGGGTFTNLAASPLINDLGQVAFQATASGTSGNSLFAGLPNSLQAVVRTGLATPIGGTYNGVGFPALNGVGQVAFTATITGGPTTSAIFAGQPSSLQAVARSGTATPAGGNFGLSSGTPVLNSNGQVAFTSSITGGTSTFGIFTGIPGNIQTVVLEGTPTPSGGNFSSLSTPMLNSVGQVAFTSTLSGTGVVADVNDNGLFAWSQGTITQIVREGDLVDVDSGIGVDFRTVANSGITIFNIGSGGEDGKQLTFNSEGLLVYKLTFTDSSVGLFTSQIETIPEPSTFIVLAAGGFIFWSFRRRCT